jgi:hypothetical protein
MIRMELPKLREVHGFQRTVCGCECCKVHCRHMPGTLDPSDLNTLCPTPQDLFAWAEQHLRALTDKSYPALVPARNAEGHCHWYFDGKCAVHASAPYGCAFFDSHMSDDEVGRRVAATIAAIREDAKAAGPYYRVWLHLRHNRLIASGGDTDAVAVQMQMVLRRAETHRRRARANL